MRKSFDNLQAARGIACLSVVIYHIAIWEAAYGISTPLLRAIRWFGFAGVDLFFVLSGFIITYAHWDQLGHRHVVPKYLFRRAWRIYPTYLFVLLLTPVLWHFTLNWPILPAESERHGWSWLTLLPTVAQNPIVPQAWTLTFELLFYIAFVPLLILPRTCGLLAIASWGLIAGSLAILGQTPNDRVGQFVLSPLVLEFVLGAMVAVAIRTGYTRFGLWKLCVGFIGIIVGSLVWYLTCDVGEYQISHRGRTLAFGFAMAIIVWGLASLEIHNGSQAPKWLLRIGDASYSIYLVHCSMHPILIVYGCAMPHSRLWHMLWLTIALTSCVGAGLLVHRFVERPALELVSHRPKRSVSCFGRIASHIRSRFRLASRTYRVK